MADEMTASATVETPTAEPEAAAPADNGIFPVTEKTEDTPEVEESATSDESEPEGETEQASDAAKQERPDSEERATETAKRQAIELRELKRQLRQVQHNQQQANQPRLMQPPVEPQLENYDDLERFKTDHAEWKAKNDQYVIQKYEFDRAQKEAQENQLKQQQELKSEWDKRAQRILKENPKFNVVEILQRVEPSPTMDGFFVDSPVGPELLDYFDNNPDEADKIRELSPFKAVRELVKLEEKLENRVKGIKKEPVIIKPPVSVTGRASAPAAPKTAAEVLYG